MGYNYANIDDREFEQLSVELISKKEKKIFQIYSKGKDGGIDGKYEKENEKIIVQAKHYINSSFTNLLNTMSDEKKKMDKEKPTRYILFTTCRLTPQNIDKIFDCMSPYILEKNDIFGLEAIDKLVDQFPDVYIKHSKIWSVELETLLSKNIYINSKYNLEEIISKKDKIVWCNQYDKALEILKKERLLLISGEPGVGKTTLAELLVLKFHLEHYNILTINTKNISEIEKSIVDDENEVIFLDDFLGQNILCYFNNSDDGSELINFIKRIASKKNKILIFTTRSKILNNAFIISDKFNNLGFNSNKKHQIIEIGKYTDEEKAKILYNHLKFSGIEKKYLKQIVEKQNYKKIFSHKNYYPRLIEHISDCNFFYDEKRDDYLNYILEHLNNPEKIWKTPFNSLDFESTQFLMTLYSFDGYSQIETFEEAFNNRMNYLNKNNSGLYKKQLELCEGAFVKIEVNQKNTAYIRYINPSIGDFLLNMFSKDKNEQKRIFETAIDLKQLLFSFRSIMKEKIVPNSYALIAIEKYKKKSVPLYLRGSEIIINFFLEIFVSDITLEIRNQIEEIFLLEFKKSDSYKKYGNFLNSYIFGNFKDNSYEKINFSEYFNNQKNMILKEKFLSDNEYLESLGIIDDFSLFLDYLIQQNIFNDYFKINKELFFDSVTYFLRENIDEEDYDNMAFEEFENLSDAPIDKDKISESIRETLDNKYKNLISDNFSNYIECDEIESNIWDYIFNLSIDEFIDWDYLSYNCDNENNVDNSQIILEETIDNMFQNLIK